MNILPFVFAVLLILSYGAVTCLEGRISAYRTQKSFLALRGAELKILQSSESQQFKTVSGVPVKKERKKSEKKETKSVLAPIPVPINAPCARLNLYPLIEEGRDAHAALYETAAKMLRLFYQKEFFEEEKRFEYKLLDAILKGAKEKMKGRAALPIETIALKDFQSMFYRMLKGTKHYRLSQLGCPALVDYWKIEKDPGKVCLFDCHPDMLAVFFGLKTAPKLYEELRNKEKPAMDLEAILQWANDPQLAFVDRGIWDLIDFKRPNHGNAARQTVIAEEDGVSIRKDLTIKRSGNGKL